jgi:hypothetical protein
MQSSGLAPVKGVAYFKYKFSKHGGSVGDISIEGNGIPKGALIDQAKIDVKTAVTSGGAATVALKAVGAEDLLAATGKATFAEDAKIDGVPDGTATNAIRTTAAINSITATVATAALTAGEFTVMVEYYRPRG